MSQKKKKKKKNGLTNAQISASELHSSLRVASLEES